MIADCMISVYMLSKGMKKTRLACQAPAALSYLSTARFCIANIAACTPVTASAKSGSTP